MNLNLTTYAELDSLVNAWANTRELILLAIISRPGLGKTEAARRTAAKLGVDRILRLDTHVTPLQLYIELHRSRNQPVILDDLTDTILGHPICLSILKSLCDSTPARHIQYNSTTPLLKQTGTPAAFETTSPVLILTNQFDSVCPAQDALLSRAIRVHFRPSIDALLEYIETWQTDHEVFAWYSANLAHFPDFSARDFAVSCSLKRAGLDWKRLALKSVGITAKPVAPTQAAIPF